MFIDNNTIEDKKDVQSKSCTRCKFALPLEDFGWHYDKRWNKKYINSSCRKCTSVRSMISAKKSKKRNKKQWDENKQKRVDAVRNCFLKEKFGITLEQYNTMQEIVGHRCQICKNPEKVLTANGKPQNLCLDHDHVTGKIRGLLCFGCNAALGKFKDSIDTLKNAIYYLEKSKKNNNL